MRVRVILLSSEEQQALGPEKAQEANMASLSIAHLMREQHGRIRCEAHPDGDSELVLVANGEGGVTLDKSGLCCEALRDRILLLNP